EAATSLTVLPDRGPQPFSPTSRSQRSGALRLMEAPAGLGRGVTVMARQTGGTVASGNLGRGERRGGSQTVLAPLWGPVQPDALADARRFDPSDPLVVALLNVPFPAQGVELQKPWSVRSAWGRSRLEWRCTLVSVSGSGAARRLTVRQIVTATVAMGGGASPIPAQVSLSGLWEVRGADGAALSVKARATTRFSTNPPPAVSGSAFATGVHTTSITDLELRRSR
ncbi:MAG: hypothetical protein NT029_01850, partial [Armatimonadetes bacterium]|nr:hypothetical protein [Armatimonadota bacterium]